MNSEYLSALYPLPERIRNVLMVVDSSFTSSAQEIRIRAGKPLMLTCSGRPIWITSVGGISFSRPDSCFVPTSKELSEIFRNLCGGSVYAHTGEMKHGYITMKSGHRAGICGTYTETGSFHDISSVNIRIARQIYGCAAELAKLYAGGGLMIAGPPGSGKTTMLRDFIRIMSSGAAGSFLRVSCIDTRGEISGIGKCGGMFDLGDNTDVIVGIDKAPGIEMAVRCLNPQLVCFDEIGSVDEARQVVSALNCGVYAITSVHIRETRELLMRPQTKLLFESGAISNAVLLTPGRFGQFQILDKRAVERNAVY